MSGSVPITKEGFDKLEKELLHLKNHERPKIIEAIEEARSKGDLSENAEYHSAKDKQGFIEGKIVELESKIANSNIINISKLSGDTARFGAKVTLYNKDNDNEVVYKLVGEYEADIARMLLSVNSPLGSSLLGKRVGESIEVNTPGGMRHYEILKVEFQ